jgi:ABC-type dipeptide/oligopeptide/nickel transport system permease subunit
VAEPASGAFAWLGARFAARPFARASVAALFVLLGIAVCAPLIANDRPLYLLAVDRGGFERARRALPLVADELAGVCAARERDPTAIERALATFAHFAGTLTRIGGPSLAARAEPLAARANALASGDTGVATAAALAAWRADVAAFAASAAPRDEQHVDGVVLVAETSFPALASLSVLEGFALGAWAGAGVTWLAARLSRSRRRLRKAALGSLVCGVCGAAAVLALGGGTAGGAASGAALKEAATDGELSVERAVFAPIAFGFGETHLGEAQEPPSWWPRGARATDVPPPIADGAQPSGARDPFAAEPREVVVLFGERPLGDPWRHPFGTDSLGRDLVARCVWGARASLAIGLVAAAAIALVGTLLGAFAGHFGGWLDASVSRGIEVVQCVPSFFLAVLALSLVRLEGAAATLAVAIVIAAFGWTPIARLVRAEFLRAAELDWVLSARSVGVPEARIVFVHVLPHALSPAIVATVFTVASAILLESALSFLGVGVSDAAPSWGAVLGDAPAAHVWWTVLFPGLFLFATVLALHRAGEALREALDPRTPS